MPMTTPDAFSIISVRIHISTVGHVSTTTDTLPSSKAGCNFNLQIQSVFHPKVRTFFYDFDISMTSPGRTADIRQNPNGALNARKYSA